MKFKYRILIGFVFLLFLAVARVISLSIGVAPSIHQPVQNGFYDYRGVIHFHTNYSEDATGTFEEIARVANQQKVDFMISTDHNTLQPLDDHKEGWYNNTLILTGEEISLEEGYLLALDIRRLKRLPDEKTEEIIADVINQGGIIFIAHPDHPKWKWKSEIGPDITGQEVLDFADQWYTAGSLNLLAGLLFYPFNASAGLIQLYHPPVEALKGWDMRNLKRSTVGIFAPDFHQAVRIVGNYKIPFPGVENVLPMAHDHLLLKTPFTGDFTQDKEMFYDALRQGHLYFSMDILGDAAGFLFSARQGDQRAWMGDKMPAGNITFFSVKLPSIASGLKTLIRVIYNGDTLFKTEEKGFNFQSTTEGAYRIEVETEIPAFLGSAKRAVWIYSNPIYLR